MPRYRIIAEGPGYWEYDFNAPDKETAFRMIVDQSVELVATNISTIESLEINGEPYIG